MFLLLTTDFLDAAHPRREEGPYMAAESRNSRRERFLGSRKGGGGGERGVKVSFSMFYQRKQGNFRGKGGPFETGSPGWGRMRHKWYMQAYTYTHRHTN